MKLTIALQDEMNATIDIPDSCKRDLWSAQMEYWLEKDSSNCKNLKIDGGFLRVIRNKIKHVRNNYG